jgi:hypothetical protein
LDASPANRWIAQAAFKDHGRASITGAIELEPESTDINQPANLGGAPGVGPIFDRLKGRGGGDYK